MTTKEKKRVTGKESADQEDVKKLVLFNDDINTFDYVIESLIEVCEHDPLQAETCTWIAHFKGKCAVKKGDLPALKKYYNEMTFRRLTVEIQ
ncbi:MAG: ATP-dependent Clp protease adaptor ClpS [Bacteroidales bacterium]|nr:ATP-dependent Clp protease adaptor ClpS [Bacteroidales bacterium]